MSRVDWITWKTNPKEIIDPNIIEDNIQENFKNYNSYMNPVVYEQIKHEIDKGILGKDKMIFMGNTPINEMALDIISKIDEIKEIVGQLVVKTKESTEQQKQIEKQQLIEEIEHKIEIEEESLKNISVNENMQNEIISMGGQPDEVIYLIEDRIKKLKERLEIARSL